MKMNNKKKSLYEFDRHLDKYMCKKLKREYIEIFCYITEFNSLFSKCLDNKNSNYDMLLLENLKIKERMLIEGSLNEKYKKELRELLKELDIKYSLDR